MLFKKNPNFHKKQHSCFNIYNNNNNNMFLEQQISILEWFPKDRVILDTAVMADENYVNPIHFELH